MPNRPSVLNDRSGSIPLRTKVSEHAPGKDRSGEKSREHRLSVWRRHPWEGLPHHIGAVWGVHHAADLLDPIDLNINAAAAVEAPLGLARTEARFAAYV